MDALSCRNSNRYPLLATTSDEELLAIALSLLSAESVEHALVAREREQSLPSLSSFVESLPEDYLEKARAALHPLQTLKTQPIIARETGRVFRAQGRPPKNSAPIYVETEKEALQLLSSHEYTVGKILKKE